MTAELRRFSSSDPGIGSSGGRLPASTGTAGHCDAQVSDTPPLLVPEIDLQDGTRELASEAYNLGRYLVPDPLLVKKAVDSALHAQHSYEAMLSRGVSSVVFLGGVAANQGMVRAFEEMLEVSVDVPPQHDIIGAIGVALLAMERYQTTEQPSSFRGWSVSDSCYEAASFECPGCSNLCEIVCITQDGELIGRWGGRCDKWDV